MRYGIAVTADTILSTVEISSTAIGAYIILLQEDSTYIIAAVVLMTSFVATTFKHMLNLSTCRKIYAAAFRIMEFSANRYRASEKSIMDKEQLLQANILAETMVSFKAAINGQVLYLTSTNYSSSDSTPSSITSSMALDTNGNVYWAPKSSATRAYQYWCLEKQGDSGETPTPEPTGEVTVTNMPANVYTDDTEKFHPKSGMRNGTWAANGGADIEQKMRNYYHTVYKANPVSNSQYLYNFYGAKVSGTKKYHLGVDICHGQGSPVYSAHSGEVIYIRPENGQVAIYDGTYTYHYLHMTDIKVNLNDPVVAGETNIGLEGKEGWATGSHVHLEIYKGEHASAAQDAVLINQNIPTVCPYDLI